MHRSTRTALALAVLLIALIAGAALVWNKSRDGDDVTRPRAPDLPRGEEPTRAPPSARSLPTPAFPLRSTPGFNVSLFATDLKKPRVLIEDPAGTILVSDRAQGTVVALPDENADGVSDSAVTILDGLRIPHGLALRGTDLYVAEEHEVVRYTYDPGTRTATNPQKLLDLPHGSGHDTRTIAFGLDDMLYVSIGSSCNVCRERDEQRAAILRVDPETGRSERWAWGLRNTVFFTFHPDTGVMLGNDMGRDHLGDDLPPDELNVILSPSTAGSDSSGDYGWPYCYGKQTPDPFGERPKGCETTEPSLFDYPAHVAPLGIAFIPESFSPTLAGDLLVAFHGSWNRSEPVGYKLVRLKITGDRVAGMEDFLTGFRTPEGTVHGRPAGILFTRDGALLIADDHAGVIYSIRPAQGLPTTGTLPPPPPRAGAVRRVSPPPGP